jgi:uncharacterized coiled-coil protein SlyX
MSTTNERVSVLETKVDNIEEKLDELKVDVKELHLCLDQTRDTLLDKINQMRESNSQEHDRVIEKLERLEGWRNNWLGAVAIIGPILAYAVAHIDWSTVIK